MFIPRKLEQVTSLSRAMYLNQMNIYEVAI